MRNDKMAKRFLSWDLDREATINKLIFYANAALKNGATKVAEFYEQVAACVRSNGDNRKTRRARKFKAAT